MGGQRQQKRSAPEEDDSDGALLRWREVENGRRTLQRKRKEEPRGHARSHDGEEESSARAEEEPWKGRAQKRGSEKRQL